MVPNTRNGFPEIYENPKYLENLSIKGKVVYPELSYQIIGVLFSVFKELGGGLQERIYQRGVKIALGKKGLTFLEQVRFDIEYHGNDVGRYFIDFVIENKIALEIKAKKSFYRSDIRQLFGYLRKSGLELGILARFGTNGVESKRILRGF